jgi:phospholipase/lecithinase/hemolysin
VRSYGFCCWGPTRYYDVSHVSLLQALWPLTRSAARAWAAESLFTAGSVHPTLMGHKMVGQLVAHFLQQVCACRL